MPSSFYFFVLGCKTPDSFLFVTFNSAEALMGVPSGVNKQPPWASNFVRKALRGGGGIFLVD